MIMNRMISLQLSEPNDTGWAFLKNLMFTRLHSCWGEATTQRMSECCLVELHWNFKSIKTQNPFIQASVCWSDGLMPNRQQAINDINVPTP